MVCTHTLFSVYTHTLCCQNAHFCISQWCTHSLACTHTSFSLHTPSGMYMHIFVLHPPECSSMHTLNFTCSNTHSMMHSLDTQSFTSNFQQASNRFFIIWGFKTEKESTGGWCGSHMQSQQRYGVRCWLSMWLPYQPLLLFNIIYYKLWL